MDPTESALIGATSPDRRTRKRDERRNHLLDLAADLVETAGIEGVTMAALAEAADYAPASLYTYFPSRSALLSSLQQRALHTLRDVADLALAGWESARAAGDPVDEPTAALTRLWAFSDLFLAAPETQPREFRLQQQFLVTAVGQDTADAADVVPAALAVLDVPRRLLAAATEAGAIAAPEPVLDPIGTPIDGAFLRTISWIVALNGALLTDRLTTGLPATGAVIGRELTAALLLGWGADPDRLATARELARTWASA